jgi:pilus assembly protein CpaD
MASFWIDMRGEEMMMNRPVLAVRTGELRRSRVAPIVAVALIGTSLAACKTIETPDTIPYSYDAAERHPITVHEGVSTVELLIGMHHPGLTPHERTEVYKFAANWQRDSTGGILIRTPVGSPNERAARDTIPEIRRILAEAGIPPNAIAVETIPGLNPPGAPIRPPPILLQYPRMVANAGPCGVWPNDLGPGAGIDYITNKPYYNLGCSQQRNLAAMVDDPADLIQPRAEIPPYTARRSVVLEKYRKGEDTTTQNQNNEKAKISDVGK